MELRLGRAYERNNGGFSGLQPVDLNFFGTD